MDNKNKLITDRIIRETRNKLVKVITEFIKGIYYLQGESIEEESEFYLEDGDMHSEVTIGVWVDYPSGGGATEYRHLSKVIVPKEGEMYIEVEDEISGYDKVSLEMISTDELYNIAVQVEIVFEEWQKNFKSNLVNRLKINLDNS